MDQSGTIGTGGVRPIRRRGLKHQMDGDLLGSVYRVGMSVQNKETTAVITPGILRTSVLGVTLLQIAHVLCEMLDWNIVIVAEKNILTGVSCVVD